MRGARLGQRRIELRKGRIVGRMLLVARIARLRAGDRIAGLRPGAEAVERPRAWTRLLVLHVEGSSDHCALRLAALGRSDLLDRPANFELEDRADRILPGPDVGLVAFR